MTKKRILSYVLLFILSVVATISAMVGGSSFSDGAEAAVSWNARVAVSRGSGYVDIATGERVSDSTTFTFLISDYADSDTFEYFVSREDFENSKQVLDGLGATWESFSPDDKKTVDGKTYWTSAYSTSNKDEIFVYFRRKYTENSKVATEYYSVRWQIIVNTSITEENLGISSVSATYVKDNKTVNYEGNWIGVGLKFAVTTKFMETNGQEYDASYELLSYSVDGKEVTDRTKKWMPMTYNYVTVSVSLDNGRVDFKVTDIAEKYASYYSYGGVKIDTAIPVFNLTATTRDPVTGLPKAYQSKDWSCYDVTFGFEDVSECISEISYYYSEDGINYSLIPSSTYTVRNTTKGLRFRAQTKAGVSFDYGDGASYIVNIDPVQPGVRAKAYTDDPDKVGATTAISAIFDEAACVYRADSDANGQVYIDMFNMDGAGNGIVNASGVRFFYAVSVDGKDYGEYRQATTAVTDGENAGYRIMDSITKGVASDRKYKFYVESGAGLRSNETVYEIKLLNSFFEIEVGEITYVPNASGWSAAPIPVDVTVPTDSVIERNYAGEITGYSRPTTKYTFFYSPNNINVTYEAEGEYYTYVENEEGKSVYRFYLSASAESTFSIYAKNGAGKRSDNTYVGTETIKIDVLKPETSVTAYVFPETEGTERLYITSGQWVNGRIVLTVTVKDGVSGVYLKDLNFAVDGAGNPVYNSRGELIWQESSVARVPDGTINGDDGAKYFIYNVEIGLPDSTVVMMSKEYRFRVYTGSGVYEEIEFTANIDASRIQLDSIDFVASDRTENVPVSSNRITLPSVCDNAVVRLVSNIEQAGHFDYYLYDEISGKYSFVSGSELEFSVPNDRKGEIVKKFYLVSRAKDYKGVGYSTDAETPYEIIIPYNTLNISINYELITDTSGTGATKWVDSNLTVQIGLVSDDEGTLKELSDAEKKNYTYFYMLIPNSSDLNLNEAIRNGVWIACDNGSYSDVGGKSLYRFDIDFTADSFYGYIALSVTNEAGFRSSTSGDVNRLLYIDRTTPDIADMVSAKSGINEKSTVEGLTTVTYYSKDEINIVPRTFDDRSQITYYYVKFAEGETVTVTQNPTGENLNGWTKLTRNVVLTAEDGYAEYFYLFYAVNELGASAGGMTGGKYSTRYKFVIDTAQMSGTLSYNPNDGGYFDQSLNMYTYMWCEAANISFNVINSNTYVKYYYSLDDGKTWEPYLEPGGYEIYYKPGEKEVKTLVFNAAYFPDGVNSAFTFKAVNKAGTEYVYGTKIYIAIDTMTPEFEVSLSVDGVEYTGGGTELSAYSSANWSNRPVTITINPIKVNVSGVKYTYTVEYLVNNTPFVTTERETPSGVSFTTDRLDGFGINRDAIITIKATSRSGNGNYSERKFRVKVDQTTPVFTLIGTATNNDNTETKTISSGEWTNYPLVSVNKSSDPDYVNVSKVSYTYTYKDLESTGVIENNWPDGNPTFNKICSITVTARSDAGLTYTREFKVNIDTKPPVIKFMRSESISIREGEEHFIDLKVYVEEENIEICEYITIKGEKRGFALDPTGYIISTSSVDNMERYDNSTGEPVPYRGYVKIYVKDYAGNVATFEFYMLPFALDVNNVTLSDKDQKTIEGYENDLNAAESYMEAARVTYFRNLISRLKDRINTLRNEIDSYRAYLEKLSQR
ncbi:MAG: hypothetical protein ACI4SK_04020, partial [Christensenellales bacterium]